MNRKTLGITLGAIVLIVILYFALRSRVKDNLPEFMRYEN
jgi:hypothetical protein